MMLCYIAIAVVVVIILAVAFGWWSTRKESFTANPSVVSKVFTVTNKLLKRETANKPVPYQEFNRLAGGAVSYIQYVELRKAVKQPGFSRKRVAAILST